VSLLDYHALYNESIQNPSAFWSKQAKELLSFTRDFHTTNTGSLENGDNAWFVGGGLNACFNCVDRHAIQDPHRAAIIYEPDNPADESRVITYSELLRHVSQLVGFLRERGVRKGNIVTIYMPMIPEAVVAVLACARIGAIHSVVFAGFSAEALRDRIQDAKSTVVITTDEGRRGGKTISTKRVVDEAVRECREITTLLVYKRTGADIPWMAGRDLWWDEELKRYPAYTPPEVMDSEDYLFLLYTSGSTGKPKGVFHSTAGYLLGAAVTGKYVFDIHPEDRFFCSGDIGWITGHTYVVYAPLALGCTTVIFEGTPTYPSHTRFWEIIQRHACTHFYGAPTAFRLLKRSIEKKDLQNIDNSQLRVVGSVGEPIAPEIWKWYYEFMGNENAAVTDVRLSFDGTGANFGMFHTLTRFLRRPIGRQRLAHTSLLPMQGLRQ
jgi:acetyl-CoA synthetase